MILAHTNQFPFFLRQLLRVPNVEFRHFPKLALLVAQSKVEEVKLRLKGLNACKVSVAFPDLQVQGILLRLSCAYLLFDLPELRIVLTDGGLKLGVLLEVFPLEVQLLLEFFRILRIPKELLMMIMYYFLATALISVSAFVYLVVSNISSKIFLRLVWSENGHRDSSW